MQPLPLSNLTVYRLRLFLEFGARRHALPAYLGSTVRGVVAASLRRMVCVTHAATCEGCPLLQQCAYPYLFETPPPPDLPAALRKRFQQAPHPYVFEVPLAYRGEATFELGLILVGHALDYLPYLLYVVQEQGQYGLGQVRVPYRLVTVLDGNSADGAVVYRDGEGIIHETLQGITLDTMRRAEDAQVEQLTMEFMTPLRIKKFGGYQAGGERVTFATMIDLLLGRLEALAFFHCGEAWAPDTTLREAARSIHVETCDLHFQSLERYSNRRQQKLPLHGLLGTLCFRGDLGAFLAVLRLGAYVHLGAGTAFGLGKYRLAELS